MTELLMSNDRNERRPQGAISAKASTADVFRAWRAHNRLVARDSLLRLIRAPMASVMTWIVIGIALALPAGLYVLLGNVQQLSRGWDGAPQISLFLHQHVDEEEGRNLSRRLGSDREIAGVEYLSRDDALHEFRDLSGFGDVLEQLDSNPLPAVIIVRPRQTNVLTAKHTEALKARLAAMPEVEFAQLDLEWVQRLYAMMELGRRIVGSLAMLLSVGVLMVIGNTIRLAIESRRDEIVVVKLVGGTDAFVRRPFLYTGVWYGLGGGIVATMIVGIGMMVLQEPVAKLAGLYNSQYRLLGLSFADMTNLWLTSAMLGWLGAWLAVARHLGDIEPQ
jgi:cell division transport system permease protein